MKANEPVSPYWGTTMIRLLQPFLLFIAASTDRELARQVTCLKNENELSRSKLPKKIILTV
jgi:hypothetical protein